MSRLNIDELLDDRTPDEKFDNLITMLKEFDYKRNGLFDSIAFLEIMKLELIKIEMGN